MDREVIIKQEPLDDFASETNLDCEEDYKFENYNMVGEIKAEPEEEITDTTLMATPSSAGYDKLSILAEKPNLITVHASETMKSLDELYLLQNLKYQDKRLVEDRESFLTSPLENPKDGKNTVERNGSTHECRKNCGKKFKTLTERAFHESHEHKSVERTIKCNFCNKNFESFFALTRHMPEHRNVQRYVCTHCSKCCTSYQDLQNHWKSSKDCCNRESDTRSIMPPVELDVPRKIAILKSTLPAAKQKVMQKITRLAQQERPLINIKPQQEISSKTSSPLLILPNLLQSQTKPLSFAEEAKAFAAKYQLKSSLVVKKRTSATIVHPAQSQQLKKSKKSKIQEFEITPKYAVPNAIGLSNSDVSNPLLNIKIKEELPDTYEDCLPVVVNEAQIKSEPIDDYVEVKNEPFDETMEESSSSYSYKSELDPDFNRSIQKLPTDDLKPLNQVPVINGTPVKGLKIIKLRLNTFSNRQAPLCNKESLNNLPFKNIKFIKFTPNAKIIKVPTATLDPSKNQTEKIWNSTMAISTNSRETAQKMPLKPIKILQTSSQSNNHNNKIYDNDKVTLKKEIVIENNDDKNDAGKLVDLVENTINKSNQRKRINSVPRQVLRYIEQQPENVKIIEELQRQIKLAESFSATNMPMSKQEEDKESSSNEQENISSELCKSSNATNQADVPKPTSLYLLITENSYPELLEAKRINRKYQYSWMCPKCPKRYEQKHAFMGHLVSVHALGREEFTNLIVEVRPFPRSGLNVTKKSASFNECKKVKKSKKERIKDDPEGNTKKKVNQQNLIPSRWCCPNCNRTCSSRTMLVDHMAGNCSRVPLYQCSKCSKSFYSASTLSVHMTIHTGELPYACNFCDKRFRTRGQVNVHHRIHTGERPFKCQICSQAFTHRETLISHLSRHIGMKRYRCYACGKHFSCVSGLKTHHEFRPNTCGRVKLNTRAVGPRVRVVRGQVLFEPQPEINPYLRTEDPQEILSEIQNIQKTAS